jgi:CrcB protein
MGQLSILGFIAIGGAFGACSRYLISELCVLLLGRGFPYGTLTVNVVGSFIMGLLIAAFENEMVATEPWRQIIGLGFLGALTTFSTFSMDNVLLMQQGAFFKMGLNVLLNVDRLSTFDKVIKSSYDLLTTRLGLSKPFLYTR